MYLKKFLLFVSLLSLLLSTSALAQKDSLKVGEWLILGPVETQLPVYHDQENIKNKTFTLSDLLDFEPIDVTNWRPKVGSTVEWSQTKVLEWESHQTETLEFETSDENPLNYWSSFYLSTDRFA